MDIRKWKPLIFAILSFVIFIVMGQVLYNFFTDYFDISNLADVREPLILIFAGVYCIVIVIYSLCLYRFLDKGKWKEFGFKFRKKEIILTIISVVLMFIIFMLYILITKEIGITNWIWSNVSIIPVLSAAFLYLTVGINEEFYFRGYFYKTLTRYGKLPAYLISGLIFVLIHFLQKDFLITYLIELTLATFIYIYIFDLTKSIWPVVLIHGAYDFFLGLFQGVESKASIIVWLDNSSNITITDQLMSITIIMDIIIFLLFYFGYKSKKKLKQ